MRLLALAALCAHLHAGERWVMKYFHDVQGEELRLGAIAFCSDKRGIATGVLIKNDKPQPTALVTSDGGSSWNLVRIEEPGHELYFFDETNGWMLTESGIWFTEECGRSWRRIYKQRGLTDLRFTSPTRGFAVGLKKTAIETSDGGKTWTPIPDVQKAPTTAERTSIDTVEFLNEKVGIMASKSHSSKPSAMPLWLDPEPQRRREKPSLTVMLETKDGGSNWTSSSVSMFGRIAKIRFTPEGVGLGLIVFEDYFDYPSEIFLLHGKTGENFRTFRDKKLAVTDIVAGNPSYLAGFVPPGRIFWSPIPGKIRVARSENLRDWKDMEVDYRAVAARVMFGKSPTQLWAATDTGMLLQLVKD